MSTLINVARIGPDAPGSAREWSLGPRSSASRITVLNGFAREFATRSPTGAFSLKWMPRGAARYHVDRAQHRLAGADVLLLQAGQPYEIEFLDRRGTESFCLFFSDAVLNEASASFEPGDDPESHEHFRRRTGGPEFADMVFRPPAAMANVLHRLRNGLGDGGLPTHPPGRIEEMLLSLLRDLVAISRDHGRLAARMPARRPSTRRMLLGRLQRARDMIDDQPDRPPTLDELAQVSCLSKFHLLRLFKAAFELSPAQYAEKCRLDRGKHLLLHTRLPVGRIAETLGYESQSAFTKMFRRHVGVTPSTYRSR
jgi:AraC family transcriptional regulator